LNQLRLATPTFSSRDGRPYNIECFDDAKVKSNCGTNNTLIIKRWYYLINI